MFLLLNIWHTRTATAENFCYDKWWVFDKRKKNFLNVTVLGKWVVKFSLLYILDNFWFWHNISPFLSLVGTLVQGLFRRSGWSWTVCRPKHFQGVLRKHGAPRMLLTVVWSLKNQSKSAVRTLSAKSELVPSPGWTLPGVHLVTDPLCSVDRQVFCVSLWRRGVLVWKPRGLIYDFCRWCRFVVVFT